MTHQEKIQSLYETIKNNFYLCRNDLSIGNDRFNSSLLFGILTELNRGKQLLYGRYGRGKTTSAEYLHSLFHNLPIDIIRRVVVRGSPQLTQEKIIGRPHYGKMHQGQEDVVWQHFVLTPPKVIDEFNRIPEANQSILLDGVDRGEWGYLNEYISQGNQPFFATCNYEDRGTNSLIPPILDRFNIATESKFPGVANEIAISYDFHNEKDTILKDPETSQEILNLLNSEKPYNEINEDLRKISNNFRKKLKKRNLETLTEEELLEIDKEIAEIELDKDAFIYLSLLVSELNIHPKYGEKRINDPITGEEGPYLFNLIEDGGTARETKSLVRYSQSLAWLQGLKQANLEHVLIVAPYTLWHRLRLTEDTLGKLRQDERRDPLELYAIKTLLGNGTNELPGVKTRFSESLENYQRVINFINDHNYKEALKHATNYASSGKGHPIFLNLIEELR